MRASAELDVARLQGPVIDEVGLIDSATAARISNQAREINQMGAAQLQIYVIKSLGGLTIEQASIQIVEKWQLGSAKQDNGVLLLIAPNERKMRIEVGQGLEGELPDIKAKRIIEDTMSPYFRSNDFSRGVEAGVNEIAKFVAPEFAKNLAPNSGSVKRSKRPSVGQIVLWVILAFLFLPLSIFRSRRGRYSHWSSGGGYWGGGGWGGSSGGGWSGGGGGFSGGGASGGW